LKLFFENNAFEIFISLKELSKKMKLYDNQVEEFYNKDLVYEEVIILILRYLN